MVFQPFDFLKNNQSIKMQVEDTNQRIVRAFSEEMDRLELKTSDAPLKQCVLSVFSVSQSTDEQKARLDILSKHMGGQLEFIIVDGDVVSVEDVARGKGQYCWILQSETIPGHPTVNRVLEVLSNKTFDDQALYCDALTVDETNNVKEYSHALGFDPILRQQAEPIVDQIIVEREPFLIFVDKDRQGSGMTVDAELLTAFVDQLVVSDVAHLAVPIAKTRSALQSSHKGVLDKGSADYSHITIIIPSRNALPLISTTLKGIFEQTNYPSFDVLVVDNGSDDPAVLALYEEYKSNYPNFSVDRKEEPFNFSRMINKGLAQAKEGHCLLLNNDIEVIENHWLKEMVRCLTYDGIGIVGAKLLYPDETIQHAGVIVGLKNLAAHWFYKEPKDTVGPNGRMAYRQTMTCVTGAVMLISKSCLDAVGAWDEENFAVAYNDVDYCMRARTAGYRCVWTPHAELFHHESATRGLMKSWRDWWRFRGEKRALKNIHKTREFKDPTFSLRFKRCNGPLRLNSNLTDIEPRRWH